MIDEMGQLDESQLVSILTRAGVDVTAWGVGRAKTVGHLLAELRDADCELIADEEGLVRRVRNVWVDVFATVAHRRYHLIEQRQDFVDGRSRERDLPASLGEKCKIGEDPLNAARRGVTEELGIVTDFELRDGEKRENPSGETSYPGLRTRYETHWYDADLDSRAFNADGYVERQEDKVTSFVWES